MIKGILPHNIIKAIIITRERAIKPGGPIIGNKAIITKLIVTLVPGHKLANQPIL